MSREGKLALAMSITESAVQDMAEAGLTPQEIAIGLAWHMCRQVDLAMPNPEAARLFRASLAKVGPPGVGWRFDG